MKKIILYFFILILGSKNITAQNFVYPFYNVEKDKPWIDSLKHIVKKGFIQDEQQRNNWKKQLTFVNTCVELGMYYERLFEQKKQPDLRQALVYYNKVADMDRFPDDPKYFKALAIRTTLFRKLAAIYFKGKGVKKDKNKSYDYALQGIAGNPGLFKFYSERYFKCKNYIITSDIGNIDFNSDWGFTFKVNPFAAALFLFNTKIIDKKLADIAEAFKQHSTSNSINISIEGFSNSSMKDQAFFNKVLDNVKDFFVQKGIAIDRIITNTSPVFFEESRYREVYISFARIKQD